jgi:hypothetical protein
VVKCPYDEYNTPESDPATMAVTCSRNHSPTGLAAEEKPNLHFLSRMIFTDTERSEAHMAVALLSTRLSGALGCWPACLFDVRRNNLDLDLFEDDADVPPLFAVYFSFPLENIWTEHKIADQMRTSLHHTWILDQRRDRCAYLFRIRCSLTLTGCRPMCRSRRRQTIH